MRRFTQDFRYALRQVRLSPGFFAMAALLIAIGVAATTQIVSLVDALLLRPLPVNNPQNLVQIFEQQEKRPADPYFDYQFFKHLTRYSSTLFNAVGQIDTVRALDRNGSADRIHAVAVTANFFKNLGVPPLLGRPLTPGDRHAVVLSYAFWSRSFGRDPNVIGQVVRLQGHPYNIIGVTPEAFSGTTVDSSPDLWMPYGDLLDFSKTPNPSLDDHVIEIIARLRPGISLSRAEQDTAALSNRYLERTAAGNDSSGLNRGRLEVLSIAHGISPLRDQSKVALALLSAGTGFLLLIVCANVGGLLLSRAAARDRDTAVRLALGASRGRMMCQWLLESFLITAAGGSAGVFIAFAAMPILMRWMPPAHGIGFDPGEIRTLTLHPDLDLRVAAFSLVVCGLTTLLCAVAPAWRSSQRDLNLSLKTTISDRRNSLFQSILCGSQLALCTALLISAGLIVQSLWNLRASYAGFDRGHVAVFSIDPHVRGYNSKQTWLLQQRLVREISNLPGVEGSAIAYRALMRGIGLGNSVVFPGQRGGVVNSSVNSVTPDYFAVMGIHFQAGRNFAPSDMAGEDGIRKTVVNQAFVRKFLAGGNPLGEKFDTGRQFVSPKYEIIGVVNDTKYRSLREVPPPIFYTDDFGPNDYPDTFILHVRTGGDPHAIIGPVRQLLRSIDPELPVFQVATVAEEVDQSLWQERLLTALTVSFGTFALLLSAIGMYGILAYFVARRRREIGLRMALGAGSAQVIQLVVRRILPTLGIGILGGAALASVAGVWARSLLYGVPAVDPVSEILAASLLIAIGIAGAALPAFRAFRIDPSSALRQE